MTQSGEQRFKSFDGTELWYEEEGEGEPVILLHGFAADSRVNWGRSAVPSALAAAGRRVVLLDARGHGQSDKPHDVSAYAGGAMAKDLDLFIDHLGAEADVIGYSMGAIVALVAAGRDAPIRSIVAGGIGGATIRRLGRNAAAIAEAMEAPDPASVTDASAKAFRTFADLTKADRAALAAVQRAGLTDGLDLGAVLIPVLVVVGDGDTLAGSPEELAAQLPDGRAATVRGDHINAVVDPLFAEETVRFLEEQS
jgi:pimeloyl-ACP methyl ester carboxylesterase